MSLSSFWMRFMRTPDKKHHTSCLSFLCVLKWTSDQGTAAAAADVQRRHCDGPADKTGRRGAAGDRKSFRMPRKAAEIRRLPEAQHWAKWERASPCLRVRENRKAWRATAPLSTSPSPPKCVSQCLHILKITAEDTRHPKIPGLGQLQHIVFQCTKLYCYRLTINTITYQEVSKCKMYISMLCDKRKWLCV